MQSLLYSLIRKGLRPENWRLLLRTLRAAQVVRGALPGPEVDPHLGAAIRAAEAVYLPRQPGWTISEPQLIASAAVLVTALPRRWGRCVQQSLITYRLLNGYGIPARVCYGISNTNPDRSGHAWVRAVNPSDQVLVGSSEPLDRFRIVFISVEPADEDRDPCSRQAGR
ncbi:MAG: lasso peptide biosynthesis B2 protein [Blastocatellia bacterium]